MEEDDDSKLFDAWQSGDAAAGQRLFERHFESIYRFLKYKVADDPADLVQRTFLACVEARNRFRKTASFKAFLFGVARTELLMYWRRRRKQSDIDFGVSSVEDLNPTPSRLAAKRQEHAQLHSALQAIPLDLQTALELYYWEGLSGPDLAEALGIPEGTVRSRLRRALEALEKKMAAFAVDDVESGIRSLKDVV